MKGLHAPFNMSLYEPQRVEIVWQVYFGGYNGIFQIDIFNTKTRADLESNRNLSDLTIQFGDWATEAPAELRLIAEDAWQNLLHIEEGVREALDNIPRLEAEVVLGRKRRRIEPMAPVKIMRADSYHAFAEPQPEATRAVVLQNRPPETKTQSVVAKKPAENKFMMPLIGAAVIGGILLYAY